MPPLPPFVRKLIPPTPMSRTLATQSLLFASGDGAFTTISAFYLLEVVGLSMGMVGVGLSIGAAFGFVMSWPIGKLVDHLGAKRLWWTSGIGRMACFLALPFIDSFGGYLVLALAFELAEGVGRTSHQSYTLDVMSPDERVRTQAYMYSSLNVGFTVGAIIGGVALGLKDVLGTTEVIRWAPLLSAAIMAVNAYWILRLPDAPHDVRRKSGGAPVRPSTPSGWRNRGWMSVSFFNGVMWTNQVLLHTVIPLWLVEKTDSPDWLLGWLFATNTVLCIFVPPYLANLPRDLSMSLRRVWISTAFFAAACAITFVTHDTRGLLTIFLVWLGHVAVTGAELAISGASWAFEAELMDPGRRGDYQGVSGVFSGIAFAAAPATYTWLSDQWGGLGWAVIAGFIAAAAVGMRPAVHSAERFAHEHFPEHFEPTAPDRDDVVTDPVAEAASDTGLTTAATPPAPPAVP